MFRIKTFVRKKKHAIALLLKILLVLLAFLMMVSISHLSISSVRNLGMEQNVIDPFSYAQKQSEADRLVSEIKLGVSLLGSILAASVSIVIVCVDLLEHKANQRTQHASLEAIGKVEEELRIALAVAEDSAKTKREFLDNMNHEIRTPMNGVLGFLQIALQSDTLNNQRENLIMAESCAKDLMRILENILDFTKIEENKMLADTVPFSVPDVFSEMSTIYALPVKARGLTLTLSYPADLPDGIVGDPIILKQVLRNLIDNAIKFTEKGKITVQADMSFPDNNHIEMEFCVRDTGIGIKAEQLKSLFEPFWQADASATRKYGGTGFGLALSKHLVTLLGGRIWAESVYDEGSAFHFTARFPLLFSSRTDVSSKVEVPDPPEEPAELTEPYDPAGVRVLLVEDVEINQIIAEEMLKGMGYMVDTAGNGQEALDMLTQQKYNVVLMDIQMPVMDGLTATKIIREKEEYKDLPIIAVSAHSLPADKERSLGCGMNDHITKPLDLTDLNMTLSKWLAKVPA